MYKLFFYQPWKEDSISVALLDFYFFFARGVIHIVVDYIGNYDILFSILVKQKETILYKTKQST